MNVNVWADFAFSILTSYFKFTSALIYILINLHYLLHRPLCPDTGEKADKTENGFRMVSRPLVLQKTFR